MRQSVRQTVTAEVRDGRMLTFLPEYPYTDLESERLVSEMKCYLSCETQTLLIYVYEYFPDQVINFH